MCKFLIDKGANLQMEDKKGMAPTHWAKKQNRTEILNLLLERGGAPLGDGRRPNPNRRPKAAAVVAAPEPKPIVNERKLPRRYMLTTLREGGFYSPMTDAEYEEFKR
jgi:ankyrin repeat protein